MSKYFPRHPVFEHSRFAHFPQCETKFHALAKTRRNCKFVYYDIYIFLLKNWMWMAMKHSLVANCSV
jgi:hypothetical protein